MTRRGDAFLPDRVPIDAYGNGGFRFAEMSHRGSILVLPSGVHAWPPASAEDLDEASFAPALAEVQAFEFLLLGTGRAHRPLPPALVAGLRAQGLRLETMDTGAAARTFNILIAEKRAVAVGLIAVD